MILSAGIVVVRKEGSFRGREKVAMSFQHRNLTVLYWVNLSNLSSEI